MGTIWGSASGSNGNRVNVWIDWWEDIEHVNNRSLVHARFYAQTKPDKTSDTYDNQGRSHFYVNGTLVTNRTGTIDFRSPARIQNLLGSWDGWIDRDAAGNASISFSGDFSIDSGYIPGGSASGTVVLATIWTPASAPTNPTLSPNPYENTVTFSWGAASPGVNNGILGYHVYYRLNYGGEYLAGLGNVTSWTPDVSGWGRGTVVDFHVAAITERGDNPWSGWSNAVTRNRVPNTPTNLSLAKAFFVPGETVRVYFSNQGDPDGNISGFEAALEQNETIRGTNNSPSANYVDVSTVGWTPGVYYRLRVRGYDAYGIRGGWSAYSPAFLLGLPIKIAPAQGAAAKTVASMKIAPAQGGSFKSVAGMKIAPVQGPINKTVF